MNVLYVAACEFVSNSAVHILSVARTMLTFGVSPVVTFRSDVNQVRARGDWPFPIQVHRETMHNGALFPNGAGPDLIHAWTPREAVRKVTEAVAARYGCPYIVHLEDNEDVIAADALGRFDYREFTRFPVRLQDEMITGGVAHPRRARRFLVGAAGVTALIDKLLEFKPEPVPGIVFWPGFEPGFLAAGNRDERAIRARFGLPDNGHVLVYNGNIHASNEAEVKSLIDAARLLHERGVPVTLLKTGANHAAKQALAAGERDGFLKDLGFVTRAEIHRILHLADVLVQPGHESPFNDYRFPCKLPEFFATRKPVVLPRTNLGRYLRDGEECLLLDRGDAREIADKVGMLLADSGRRREIGEAGWKFAREHLNWERNLKPVADFYRERQAKPLPATPAAPEDEPPVRLERASIPAREGSYLANAAYSVANPEEPLSVDQAEGAPLVLYEKWLAATVQHALSAKKPAVSIRGWREEAEWREATERGYAAGVANYLRDSGLAITDAAVERAFAPPRPAPAPADAKTANWTSEEALTGLVRHFGGSYRPPRAGYASVRDYCDSVERMRCLATIHGDLKNVQRPWMIKAILGTLPPGARLLEIGAGEPWVADMLARAGYEAWVVDPYDGSGNGPLELAQFMRECPNVRFIQDVFSAEMLDLPAGMFDCIYSISVLEHIDGRGLAAVGRGTRRFLKPDGFSIHAIDHIYRGKGAEEDLERLRLLSAVLEIPWPEIQGALDRLDLDPEVYFLSAEGFNQWRGRQEYEEFPMRRWVSIQLLSQRS